MKTVEVKHRTSRNKAGVVNIVKAKSTIEEVVCEYDDGKVQVSSGDVWYVEPGANGTTYQTVVKFDKLQQQFA